MRSGKCQVWPPTSLLSVSVWGSHSCPSSPPISLSIDSKIYKGYKYKGCLQDNTAGTQGGRCGPPLPGPLTVLHLPRHLPAPPPAGPQEEHPRLGSSKPLLSPRSGGSRWRRPGRTPGGAERTTQLQPEIARWKTRRRRIGWRSRNPGRRRIRRRLR